MRGACCCGTVRARLASAPLNSRGCDCRTGQRFIGTPLTIDVAVASRDKPVAARPAFHILLQAPHPPGPAGDALPRRARFRAERRGMETPQ
jgi:hypothetical protein